MDGQSDVATRKREQLPHWIKVFEVFKTDSDAAFLQRAGVSGFDDRRYEQYSQRLALMLGGVCEYFGIRALVHIDITNADELNGWLATENTTDKVLVKIMVSKKA